MGAREWYYVGKFGQVGPLPEDHITDLAACGVISGETFVWCEGMSDWKRVGEVDVFRLKVPAAIPPPFAQMPSSSHAYAAAVSARLRPPNSFEAKKPTQPNCRWHPQYRTSGRRPHVSRVCRDRPLAACCYGLFNGRPL